MLSLGLESVRAQIRDSCKNTIILDPPLRKTDDLSIPDNHQKEESKKQIIIIEPFPKYRVGRLRTVEPQYTCMSVGTQIWARTLSKPSETTTIYEKTSS